MSDIDKEAGQSGSMCESYFESSEMTATRSLPQNVVDMKTKRECVPERGQAHRHENDEAIASQRE